MAEIASDRNLLFGMVARQMNFISRDALTLALEDWAQNKAKPLGQILAEHGAISGEQRILLDALVREHLKQHGGSPQQSLAALATGSTACEDLQRVADPDVQASVNQLLAQTRARSLADVYDSGTRNQEGVDLGVTRAGALPQAPPPLERFRIIRPHAKGGLGEVFVAHDGELQREVALKQIQDRHADSPVSRARFMLEAEVTGRLEHPGIVPVYGLGQYADGRPFYAMRFIRGDSLKDAIAQYHAKPDGDPGERAVAFRKLLQRFLDVCNAIAYAHSRGVLHRDLKPGNIMLGKFGETLVVDWGLAKALDWPEDETATEAEEPQVRPSLLSGTAETMAGSAIGTPQYMSPEQAAGRLDLLGPGSDVYSLGATLYCLLTGEAPFTDKDIAVLLQKVQRGEFPRPRQVARAVPPALEAICLKAMALKPADRYATPRALADDVEHWLGDEPVAAYREPLRARLWRWARRHKGQVGAGVAALLVLGTLGIAWGLVSEARQREQEQTGVAVQMAGLRDVAEGQRTEADKQRQRADEQRAEADKQRQRAEDQEKLARRYLYFSRSNLAGRAWHEADLGRMRELLEEQRAVPAGAEDLRGFEWHYLWRQSHVGLQNFTTHTAPVRSVAFSPDGNRLVSASDDKSVRVWDLVTGQEALSIKLHASAVQTVTYSPDGKHIASGSMDRTAQVWDAASGAAVLNLNKHTGSVYALGYSPDGKRIATGSYDQTVKVWEDGKEISTFYGHKGTVYAVAFSPDGKRVVSSSQEGIVKIWDPATGQEDFALKGFTGTVYGLAYSPDGKRIVTGAHDQNVRVWDATTGQGILLIKGHTGYVRAVAFSPDGKRIASGSDDQTMKVWDAATGQELLSFKGYTAPVRAVAFSPDGKRIASGSDDRSVKVWEPAASQEALTLKGPPDSINAVAFSPDASRIAVGSDNVIVGVWNAVTGKRALALKGHSGFVLGVAFSPDGKRLASGSGDRTVKLWNAVTGLEERTLEGHTGGVYAVAFSPDGRRLASGSFDQTVKVWDTATGAEVLPLKGHAGGVQAVVFSPDGRRIISGSSDRTVKVWDAATGEELRTLQGHSAKVNAVAISPDGRRIASGAADRTVKVWDAATGREALSLQGYAGVVYTVAFSPDGNRIASGSFDRTVRVWDALTGQEALSLKGHAGSVHAVAFSPDGRHLASGSLDQTVRVWNASKE